MLTTLPTEDGYEFYHNGTPIAIGVYDKGLFTVVELDNQTSNYPNAMVAMGSLRKKYEPEYYSAKIKPYNDIKPRVGNERDKLHKYTTHPALKDVHPLAMEIE